MKIESILGNLSAAKTAPAATTKVASANTTAPAQTATPPVKDVLRTALSDALTTAKTASLATSNPVTDVEKLASELAAMETRAQLKEAELMGVAFADAAIARISEWQKTASAQFPASVGEDQLKQAAEAGYRQAVNDMQKHSAEEYDRGYNETVELIHKVAATQFMYAAQKTAHLVQLAAQQ